MPHCIELDKVCQSIHINQLIPYPSSKKLVMAILVLSCILGQVHSNLFPNNSEKDSHRISETFASSFDFFQNVDSFTQNLFVSGSDINFAIVTPNLVYTNLVQSGTVVHVIVILTSQVMLLIIVQIV